jgi:hypothetical protein
MGTELRKFEEQNADPCKSSIHLETKETKALFDL